MFDSFDNDNESFLLCLKTNCSVVDESVNTAVEVKINELLHDN